jgi:ketosteroid isomerase-like protein
LATTGEKRLMDASDGKKVVDRFLNLHEPDTFDQQLQMLHETCVLELPFIGVKIVGKSAILEHSARTSTFTSWKKGTFVDRKILATDEPGVYIAEARGDMVLPNGVAYRNIYIMIFGVRDGQISRAREYFNPVVIAEARAAKAPSDAA